MTDLGMTAAGEPFPSLDGRRFKAVENSSDGQVSGETQFVFSQEGRLVHAHYSGGTIDLGFLVGVASGGTVEFRYVHVDRAGLIASGHSIDTIDVLADGRLRLHERWKWDSKIGSGTSILEEIR